MSRVPGLRLLEPLGWAADAATIALDDDFSEWGDSRYIRLTLTGLLRLADALDQLHILLPVLDESKHYCRQDQIQRITVHVPIPISAAADTTNPMAAPPKTMVW